MPKIKDLVGEKIGRYTVLEFAGVHITSGGYRKRLFKCRCDCGVEKIVKADALNWAKNHNLMISCGCYTREINSLKEYPGVPRRSNHVAYEGEERLHRIWAGIKRRCFNPSEPAYKNYGGRGITICEEWKNGFRAFADWAKANGYNDSLTVERIDVNGNYCPENCKWITLKEQGSNRRNNHFITYNGETLTINQWALKLKIPRTRIKARLKRGWSIEEAFSPIVYGNQARNPRKKLKVFTDEELTK